MQCPSHCLKRHITLISIDHPYAMSGAHVRLFFTNRLCKYRTVCGGILGRRPLQLWSIVLWLILQLLINSTMAHSTAPDQYYYGSFYSSWSLINITMAHSTAPDHCCYCVSNDFSLVFDLPQSSFSIFEKSRNQIFSIHLQFLFTWRQDAWAVLTSVVYCTVCVCVHVCLCMCVQECV